MGTYKNLILKGQGISMETKALSKEFIKFMINMKKYIRSQLGLGNKPKLTEQQFITLFMLKKDEKIALKKLSSYTQVSTSSLCIMLNKMVNEDLVSREVDEIDRRNTFYGLTDKGVDLLDEETEKRLIYIGEKIDKLSLKEKDKLYNCIKDIQEIIEKIE